MRFPLGRKGFLAVGGAVGALAFWKVRSRRREQQDREWEAEVAGAVDQGRSTAETSAAAEHGGG